MTAIKRKGSKSIKEIPHEILMQLNRGEIESANLVEWLAIDQRLLLENLLIQNDRLHYFPTIWNRVDSLSKKTVNTVNEAIGNGLNEQITKHQDNLFFEIMSSHPSDAVRCWAAYSIGKDHALHVTQKLEKIQPYAADKHFGVREIAWLAVRSDIIQNLPESLAILSTWTIHSDENIRRFASEATRPRGVWCAHIEALKKDPELGIVILDPLKSDKAKYVQDSVGNWLNDASKTKPEFVKTLCKSWELASNTKETKYIIKKAMRSITC